MSTSQRADADEAFRTLFFHEEKGETGMSDETDTERDATADAATKPKRTPGRPIANPRQRKAAAAGRKLIETKGPKPETPLKDVRLSVGRLAGSHGVSGELKLRLLTDSPEHLLTIKQVYLGDDPIPLKLLGYRQHGEHALIRLEGVTTPERAKAMGGLTVKISGADARPLAEGEYFLFQLIGLRAVDEEGHELGTVTDLMETGAHDVLVIGRADGGEDLLVPNHPEFVLEVAPERGVIVLRPPVYPEKVES